MLFYCCWCLWCGKSRTQGGDVRDGMRSYTWLPGWPRTSGLATHKGGSFPPPPTPFWLALLLPTFYSSDPLSASVIPLPYIETVSAKKMHCVGGWLRKLDRGVNKHSISSDDRLKALRAGCCLLPPQAPPLTVSLHSSTHATSTHNKPSIKDGFWPRFENYPVAL